MGKHGISDQVGQQAIQYSYVDDEVQINKASNDVSFAFYSNGSATPSFHIDAKTGNVTYSSDSSAAPIAIVSRNNDFYIKTSDHKNLLASNYYSGNLCVGYGAGAALAGSSDANNVCVGENAGASMTTATHNVVIGMESAYNLATGSHNVIVGSLIPAYSANATYTMVLGRNIIAQNPSPIFTPKPYLRLAAGEFDYLAMDIEESGIVSLPNNSFVSAAMNARLEIGPSDETLIPWGAIEIDRRIEMSPDGKTFTPKVAGIYEVDCHIATDSYQWSQGDWLKLFLRKNTNIERLHIHYTPVIVLYYESLYAEIHAHIKLAPPDFIDFFAQDSYFGRFLIGDGTRCYLNITKVG